MVARGPEALAEPTHTTCPAVRRLRGLSAVPCHGTRELRGQATAAVKNTLNQYKVDREERPYIDAFYMGSLHIWRAGRMAADDVPGHEARPFWAGHLTPGDPMGKPRYRRSPRSERIYREEPEKVRHNADLITDMLKAPERSGWPVSDYRWATG